MLQFESKTFNDIFLHFFYHTRSSAALQAADLENHEKPTWSHENRPKKMPKIDTLDALEEHEEHEDDHQTNSNW